MASGLFVAFRPRLLSLKNSWFHSTEASLDRAVRLGIIISAALFIPGLIFLGITESLSQFQQSPGAVRYIIELINFTLISILFFSSSVHALHTLFLSRDNDLLLAAPLTKSRLFAAKLLETTLSASWVMALFYLPTMYAVGSAFDAQLAFFIFTLLDLVPLIAIPVSLGFITSILFVRVYPARRVKELFIASSLLFVILLHFSLRGHELLMTTIKTDLPALIDSNKLGTIHLAPQKSSLGVLSLPLESAKSGNIILSSCISTILYSFGALCILSAYRCFCDLYYRAYSSDALSQNAMSFKTRRKVDPHRPRRTLFQAMTFKDYRLFFRDVTQPVQLLLFILMGIAAIFGLQASSSIGASIRESHRWWDNLVLIFNIFLHTIICVLFSARFLFPSISAEGEAQWILKAAPLSSISLLKVKLSASLIPSSILLSALIISGGILSELKPEFIAVAALAGLLNIYCVSGIAIGCGAYFSNMRYEHMGQVTAGLGSFFFMLIALMVVPWNGFVAMFGAICISILFDLREFWEISAITLIQLYGLNALTVRYFLHKGQQRLDAE